MRKTTYRPFVFLILALFVALSLPQKTSQNIRSLTVSSLSSPWYFLHWFKTYSIELLAALPQNIKNAPNSFEIEQLKRDNQMLRAQMIQVREWLLFEERIQEQCQLLNNIRETKEENPQAKEFYKRRALELCQSLSLELQAIPAKVVFRDPSSWSSSLWLNVGEKDNRALGKKVVAKNSPVVVGSSIVGVVEYVGEKQARIRLISDSGLNPSVRAVRGSSQNQYLLKHLDALLMNLEWRPELFTSGEEKEAAFSTLLALKRSLAEPLSDHYLAKGELAGVSAPLWRCRGQTLHGYGFNYDYADDEGPARDLRMGYSLDANRKTNPIPLLKVGDLLMTTGMDGVFPAGFSVATVSSVAPLREGASSYEIEAIATAGNLEELSSLFVLPPLEFIEADNN